jgi:hypothetical protein
MLILKSARKGKLTTLGAPDVKQSHAYLPDWAQAAVMLAEMRSRLAVFEDVPFPGHTFTMEELRQVVAEQLGRPIKMTRFPWWSISLMAPFNEMMREFKEMRYLNDMPHWLGADKFDQLLPDFRATDRQTAILAGLPRDIDGHAPVNSAK